MMTFIIGAVLSVIMVVICIYFFSAKRKDHIEQAKYNMLDDDDEQK